jgi:hypothetical protein
LQFSGRARIADGSKMQTNRRARTHDSASVAPTPSPFALKSRGHSLPTQPLLDTPQRRGRKVASIEYCGVLRRGHWRWLASYDDFGLKPVGRRNYCRRAVTFVIPISVAFLILMGPVWYDRKRPSSLPSAQRRPPMAPALHPPSNTLGRGHPRPGHSPSGGASAPSEGPH